MTSAQLFSQACRTFIDLVAKIQPEQWEQEGLGTWDLRSLVGHTGRAMLTVETYLALDEPGHISMETAEDYFRKVYSELTEPPAVAARGVDAGRRLGDEPVATLTETEARVRGLIEEQPRGRVVSIGGLGIPLDEYLRTRTFELVVHSLDISRATGIPVNIADAPLEATLSLAVNIARAKGDGPALLLALTGREPLPEGFTVV